MRLAEEDFKANLFTINRLFLDIELYLDKLKAQKISRKIRLTLNKFEKGFKELKIYLFLNQDLSLFNEKALSWANILQHRATLA